MRAIIPFCIIFFFACNNKVAKYSGHIVRESGPAMWLSGLIFSDDLNAMNAVAAQYGFHYEMRFGCVPSKEQRDSIKSHNHFLEKTLSATLGTKWKQKLDYQATIMRTVLNYLHKFLQQNKAIQEKNQQCTTEAMIYYELSPGSSKNHVVVSACADKVIADKLYKYEYYKALIDGEGTVWFNK